MVGNGDIKEFRQLKQAVAGKNSKYMRFFSIIKSIIISE